MSAPRPPAVQGSQEGAKSGPTGQTADEVIAHLGLSSHPEGGWYRQTYEASTLPGQRAASTAIFYLLRAGDVSAWHRVLDADEVWHFYAGSPLELRIATPPGVATLVLGVDLRRGQIPQAVVSAGCWQSARALGAWTLVGCTVAPGFEFRSFELAPRDWEPPTDGGAVV